LIFTGANIEYFSFARCAKTTENLQIFNHGIFFVSRPIFHKETDFAKLTKDQRREQDQDMAARYETDFAKLTKDQRREQDQDMAARYKTDFAKLTKDQRREQDQDKVRAVLLHNGGARNSFVTKRIYYL
jgi:hypothetical protein